jgi:septum formation protein
MEFEVVVPDVEELEDGDPKEMVVENALRKARSVPGDLVLGVDTTVVLDGRSYGKPQTEGEAREVLELLSGRTHEVWSGIALNERTATACTKVTFRQLTDPLLDWYLASGEWRERAGGYAIQGKGAALVERIDGDFWNVVGLPVPALLDLLG